MIDLPATTSVKVCLGAYIWTILTGTEADSEAGNDWNHPMHAATPKKRSPLISSAHASASSSELRPGARLLAFGSDGKPADKELHGHVSLNLLSGPKCSLELIADAIVAFDKDHLPLVLLGIRSTLKSDLDCSIAELVFGATARLPGEMISPSLRGVVGDSTKLLHRLPQLTQTISPVPPRPPFSESYVEKYLAKCSHILLRCDQMVNAPVAASNWDRTLPVAPQSWILPSGHTPGNRHDWWATPGEGLRCCVFLYNRDGDSLLNCHQCDRTFTSGIGLVDHLRIHRTETSESVPGAPTHSRARHLHCPHCPRALTHRIGLYGPMRIHDSGIHCNADTTDTSCTPSAPAILTATTMPTTMNDIPQPLPISPAHKAPASSTHASALPQPLPISPAHTAPATSTHASAWSVTYNPSHGGW
ncbi:unnamed protein product [Schistocephalus solidus]|uniref:C2H2-type domain-containing protein n=1 Tax=Schistocephalus solidus TaxID=70667 RepID=A0A183SYF7_SCHSO|nr:unnamed protein product [Schistocephalus solidus]